MVEPGGLEPAAQVISSADCLYPLRLPGADRGNGVCAGTLCKRLCKRPLRSEALGAGDKLS